MKVNISQWVIKVAVRLSKISILKCFLSFLYWKFIRYKNHRRNQRFLKYGIQTLDEFDKILVDNNIHYAVFAGTLLGAIREKGFLKHDLDIDTVMFNSNYSKKTQELLEKNGFKLKHYFLVSDGQYGREETFEKNGVTIDVFYIYEDDPKLMYLCDFHVEEGALTFEDSMNRFGHVCARRIELPLNKETRRVAFENIAVNVPSDAEVWLKKRYGDDYMVPNPNYQDKKDTQFIKEWEEMKNCSKFFRT